MINPKNNEELKKLIIDGVINCNGQDLICDFDIDIDADINNAEDITAWNIKAWNIDARHIDAKDIIAWNITYYAVCFAYYNIRCKSIKGRRENSKHFVLDGKIEVGE